MHRTIRGRNQDWRRGARRGLPYFHAALLPSALGLLACNLNPGHEEWTPASKPAEKRALATREPCAQHDPARRALFGDLHVHTGISMDASVMATLASPDDAFRFARGGELSLTPPMEGRRSSAIARLARPLDFAAVTDHSEWLGETSLCRDESSPAYATESCRIYRGEKIWWVARVLGIRGFYRNIMGLISSSGRNEEICGVDGSRCRERALDVWAANQAAAERWYDRSATCSFTSFHGFEYSRSPDSTKIHRNVIFRNEIVPELPISWIDAPTEPEFWSKLASRCVDGDSGCDAVAIPHNPNLSNGNIFSVWYRDLPLEAQREQARLRARLEPIVEMVQIKGESECRNGSYGVVGGPDELCGFEKARDMRGVAFEDCKEGTGKGAQAARGCISRLDYVRYALIEGLREAERIGVDPYVVGFIGSSDTHQGNPGDSEERRTAGAFDADPREILTLGDKPRPEAFNGSGGLAGVYAEENSRDSIFDALERRETFATSGSRIEPRFFAGWDLPEDACASGELVSQGYARGVPMGDELPARPSDAATLRFYVAAQADPESAPLDRLQIVKAWYGSDGLFHESVIEAARGEGDASVDPATCAVTGNGPRSLCAVVSDPGFDASRAAVYYARIVETPTCRWTTWRCNALPEADRPDGCRDARVPKTIQERAWTSPIWFTPAQAEASPAVNARS